MSKDLKKRKVKKCIAKQNALSKIKYENWGFEKKVGTMDAIIVFKYLLLSRKFVLKNNYHPLLWTSNSRLLR